MISMTPSRTGLSRSYQNLINSIMTGLAAGWLLAAQAQDASLGAGWQQISQLTVAADKRVSFVEARKTPLQKRPNEQRGQLWINTAGEFVMQVDVPKRETRTLSEQSMSLTRNGKTRTAQINPDNAQHQVLLAIVYLLQGNTKGLQNVFSLAPSSKREPAPSHPDTSSESWRRALIPAQPHIQKRLTALHLSGDGNRLRSIRAEFRRGWQEITLLHGSVPAGD